ncbi:hypothetical protein APHAL10511_002624 [Amanita phalloides]|nr:hypothetical protein APHAL10511_002624 [Amanita phalloides]
MSASHDKPWSKRRAPRERDASIQPDETDFLRELKPTPLETIAPPRPAQHDANVVISDTTYLGSYDWTARSIPTIVVPGMPGQWYDQKPFHVDRDTGICIVDQNTHRLKEAPLLPLVVAVDANEDADTFKWSNADYVTDRNALRKIMRWAGEGDVRDFRIDLQLAGKKTIMMCRWNNKTTEPFVGFTYGFNYFNKCTKRAHHEATGHHRIINYKMNGLNMVVRYTVDGFIPASNATSDVEDVAESLASLDISKKTVEATSVTGTSLHVIAFGTKVPQESIVEIATISKARENQLNWDEKAPQLFLSQTYNFYVGLHDRGFFTTVRKRDFNPSALSVKVRINLKKLRCALGIIQEVMVKYGQRGRVSLVCREGVLKVYERVSEETFLPDDYMQRFGI